VNQVERFFGEWQFKYARLHRLKTAGRAKIRLRGIDRETQVDPDDASAPAHHHVGDAPHSAADIENQPAANVLRRPSGVLGKCLLGELLLTGPIELRRAMDR